jgi:O-antigen ligase
MLDRPDSRLWRATAIAGGVLLLVPLPLVVVSPVVPLALRVLLTVLWLTALVRPHVALIALTLLAPFGPAMLTALDAAPVQYTEALVLATLSGVLLAATRDRRAVAPAAAPSLGLPAALFLATVLTSLGVVLAVSQVGVGMRWLFFSNVGTFLARDYLVGAPGQWTGIAAACQLLEGILLLLLVARLASDRVTRPLQILKATAAAAAAAAALSLGQLLSLGLILAVSVRDLITRLMISRISVHAADLNAAGSYYAMAGCIAGALALHQRQRRSSGWLWGAMTVGIILALWVTGSRAAAVAAAIALVGAAIVAGRRAWGQRPRWLIVAGVVVACVAGALILGFDPRVTVVNRGLSRTFESRAAFITTGLRMIASAPIFGVGIGRYYEMSGRFMPSSIYWFFFHENAHNNFLQVGGELGLVGLAAFLWLLSAVVMRMVRGLRASADDRLLAGALTGVAAFAITWMSGHPLLSPEVAFPFWILLGAAVARADGNRRTPLTGATGTDAAIASASGGGSRLLLVAAILALAVSVPFRAREASAELNLGEQSFGFYAWEGEPASGRMRWTSPSAALFIPANTTEVELPMRAAFSERRKRPTVVSIAIDGRVFHNIAVTNGDVFPLHLRLPAPASPTRRPRRLDIITNPPWSPADVLGTHDNRVLGVQVGDVVTR